MGLSQVIYHLIIACQKILSSKVHLYQTTAQIEVDHCQNHYFLLGYHIDVENYRPGRNGREGGETVMYVVHYIFCTAIFVTLVKDFF